MLIFVFIYWRNYFQWQTVAPSCTDSFFFFCLYYYYIFLSAGFSRGKDKGADLLSRAFEGPLPPGMLK